MPVLFFCSAFQTRKLNRCCKIPLFFKQSILTYLFFEYILKEEIFLGKAQEMTSLPDIMLEYSYICQKIA
ncbi:hypothetical protein J2S21_000059 [Peribacillus cavernae]|nr:hypothetical protein [Peribacillus cavernae]